MSEQPWSKELPKEHREYLDVAEELARRAGVLLVENFERSTEEHESLAFKSLRELVTDADTSSEHLLVTGLRERFPEHAILAEEGVLSPTGKADKEARFCWVIDPLDGTTNFVHRHPFFSVSLGLLKDGDPYLGVVHAPMIGGLRGGMTWTGAVGYGAWKDGRKLRVSRTDRLVDAVVGTGFSYNRNEEGINDNHDNFGRLLMAVRGMRRCGSAALDLAMTAEGIYDAYWELYLQPYDVAAGIALVRAAGGEVMDLGSGEGALFGGEILASNGAITDSIRPLLSGKPRTDPA